MPSAASSCRRAAAEEAGPPRHPPAAAPALRACPTREMGWKRPNVIGGGGGGGALRENCGCRQVGTTGQVVRRAQARGVHATGQPWQERGAGVRAFWPAALLCGDLSTLAPFLPFLRAISVGMRNPPCTPATCAASPARTCQPCISSILSRKWVDASGTCGGLAAGWQAGRGGGARVCGARGAAAGCMPCLASTGAGASSHAAPLQGQVSNHPATWRLHKWLSMPAGPHESALYRLALACKVLRPIHLHCQADVLVLDCTGAGRSTHRM